MRDARITARLVRLKSRFDGRVLTVLRLDPRSGEGLRCYFFHGMDGDAGDGVILRDLPARAGVSLVCPGGRGPAWLSSGFIRDAEQVIRSTAGPRAPFYLSGVSMGATQALSLAGLLPPDLRSRCAGILALIPGGDLVAAEKNSSAPRVRQTLLDSVAGRREILSRRSPVEALKGYRAKLPILLIYNLHDTVLPAAGLQEYAALARRAGHPVTAIPLPGDHGFYETAADYAALFGAMRRGERLPADLPRRPDDVTWFEPLHGPRPVWRGSWQGE